jgi:hypothetical protein
MAAEAASEAVNAIALELSRIIKLCQVYAKPF